MDSKLNINELGLYIHIPFCHTKCTYCDFNTYTGIENLIDNFSSSICNELEFWKLKNKKFKLNSIFFGGGTPSYIDSKILANFLEKIETCFNISDEIEISMEINPEDVNIQKANSWKKMGINRCSLGIQSLNDEELKIINRRHNARKALDSIDILKNRFDNVSVDLIYGIPKQTLESYLKTLKKIVEKKPTHISSYSLQIEKGTLLDQQVSNKKFYVATDDISADMYLLTQKVLKENNYEHYEISNWSKKGFKSRHNLKYWTLQPYIGIGPGAHSFIDKTRFSIVKSPKKYIELMRKINQKKISTVKRKIIFLKENNFLDVYESQNKENEILEYLMLNLRLENGINTKDFKNIFGLDFQELYLDKLRSYIKNNIIIKNNKFYKLSEKGKLFANEVANNFVE